MISGDHAHIRAADSDDAPALIRLHRGPHWRAALLDQKREPLQPVLEELAETLGRKEAQQGAFYVIEDHYGKVRGYCGLRGMNAESAFAEIILLFEEEALYGEAMADEAFDFVCARAFVRARLNKIMVQCLETETGLRQFLLRHGFESNGVQREVFYSSGRYWDIESFGLQAPARESEACQ